MDDWFQFLSSGLWSSSCGSLRRDGFVVMGNAVPAGELAGIAQSYDDVMAQAPPEDVKNGSATTRLSDLRDRSAAFDGLYLYAPLLEACCQVIEKPFTLSTMLARTLKPRMPAQRLHVDFAANAHGWPMVGFILMVDDFTNKNGAACFVPASQSSATLPCQSDAVPACGPAGSMIIYNGSVWHGHGANETDRPRRSIQGAYIRRTEQGTGRARTATLNRTTTQIDCEIPSESVTRLSTLD